MLGLHFCMGFSLVEVRRGHSLAVMLGFLTARWFLLLWNTDPRASWSSVVAARGLRTCSRWALEHWLKSCGARGNLLRGIWGLPGSGLKPVSPALVGTEPPWEAPISLLK